MIPPFPWRFFIKYDTMNAKAVDYKIKIEPLVVRAWAERNILCL